MDVLLMRSGEMKVDRKERTEVDESSDRGVRTPGQLWLLATRVATPEEAVVSEHSLLCFAHRLRATCATHFGALPFGLG